MGTFLHRCPADALCGYFPCIQVSLEIGKCLHRRRGDALCGYFPCIQVSPAMGKCLHRRRGDALCGYSPIISETGTACLPTSRAMWILPVLRKSPHTMSLILILCRDFPIFWAEVQLEKSQHSLPNDALCGSDSDLQGYDGILYTVAFSRHSFTVVQNHVSHPLYNTIYFLRGLKKVPPIYVSVDGSKTI
jgi:hypothetical protein